ncbi:MAG: hypothetical protein ACOCXH_14465, partial [Cyclobacteriaceae bacterium]
MVKNILIILICLSANINSFAGIMPDLEIAKIEPTALFKKENGVLVQAVNFHLQAKVAKKILRLEVLHNQQRIYTSPAFKVTPGANKLRVFLPDFRDTVHLNFQLFDRKKLIQSRQEEWIPQPHWQLNLVHSSHHDLGYTDLPDRVLEEHKGYVAQAISYCEQTENWPAEARFHYTFEQAFSVAYFLQHNQDQALQKKLIKYLKNGQLEVTALLANQTTDISEAEELNRAVYHAFQMQRDFDIPINVAEINDIPGINWGLVNVLASSGIKYLYAGIQDY